MPTRSACSSMAMSFCFRRNRMPVIFAFPFIFLETLEQTWYIILVATAWEGMVKPRTNFVGEDGTSTKEKKAAELNWNRKAYTEILCERQGLSIIWREVYDGRFWSNFSFSKTDKENEVERGKVFFKQTFLLFWKVAKSRNANPDNITYEVLFSYSSLKFRSSLICYAYRNYAGRDGISLFPTVYKRLFLKTQKQPKMHLENSFLELNLIY